ncbi:ABC transporter substrate-binding protein [Occultella gossypii]|uniref:Extracellular solute-binding protein n=1 Tax=Occultella gossypii TaxID=2800820 RepID=A0ABS7S740_9MICO|nr:extracellular solute-binding protein [Occultella gossypii]MBZ2195429.1 extracellular solute-binding protein [Occultella gossypii]
MRQRRFIAMMAAAALTMLSACSLDGGSDDPGSVEQDADAPLTLLTHPTIYGALGGDEFIAEFEEATGISVDVTTADIGPHLDKLIADYQAGSGTYDLVALQNIDYMPRVTDGLLPLDDFISGAPQVWDWDDFLASTREFAAVDGTQYGVPVRLGTQVLYYRTDLLSAAGIEPPATFEEYVSAATALDTAEVNGAVQRGVPRELANDWLGFLYSAGGTILDDEGQCALDGDAGLAATDMLVALVENEALPTDFLAWGRDDYISSMQQGNAAMGVYFSPYWGLMANPEESTVADSLGYALAPVVEGVAPGTSRAQTWNLSITEASTNQEGAWEFIQRVTSVENSLRSATEFSNGPVRTSTYTEPSYVESNPVAGLWLESGEVAQVDPPIGELPEIIDIIATQVTSALDGSATSVDALTAACQQVDRVLG